MSSVSVRAEPAPAASRPAGGRAPRFRWVVLALATAGHASGSVAALAVAPLAPFLVDALGLSRGQVGLLLPAVYLGGVLMAVPAGWLTERRGVGLALTGGLLVAGGMVVLAALAASLPALLGWLVLAGFGFSVLNPTTGKAVYDWFPARERGAAMGIKQAGLTLGGIAAALVLPPIAAAVDWRLAMATAGGAAVATGLVIAGVYRTPPPRETAAPAPPPALSALRPFLRRRAVAVVFAAGLALSVAQSSLLGFLVLFARETFPLSAVEAARMLALAHLGGVVGRLGWGFASDRYFLGRRRPGLAINAVIGAVAYAGFALGDGLPLAAAAGLAFVAGIGAFGWVGLYFALVAEIGGAASAGLVTGLATVFAWSGVLVGPPLFGWLLSTTDSYRVPWLVLAAVALAVAAVLPRLRPLVDRG
jgi:ACS family hexuronate transporter-like MFS transporter